MSNFNNNGLGDGGLSKSREKQLGTAVVDVNGRVTGLFKNDNIPQATCDSFPLIDASLLTDGIDPIQVKKDIAAQIVAINDAEETALKTIHARYCIPRALHIDINDISRYYPDEANRNHYLYFYKFGTSQQFKLMERNLVVENGETKLYAMYNPKIARDGE